MRRLAPISLVLAAALTMPGCIIWDAYDQLELANQQLGDINTNLEEIDANLVTIDAKLATIDAKLATIDANLDTVDASLSKIQPMLVQIDGHLASLRKTINNIDSTIPFLKLSGDDDDEKDALETGEDGQPVPVEIDADPSLIPAEKKEENDDKSAIEDNTGAAMNP